MALVELIRLPNGVEAELLRGRLESAGLLIPVRVMVLDEDLEEARTLMAEFGVG